MGQVTKSLLAFISPAPLRRTLAISMQNVNFTSSVEKQVATSSTNAGNENLTNISVKRKET